MEKLKHILIGEKIYPFRIDLNVLEYIQEFYGSIGQFERDLLGIRYKKDADGNQIYDDKGEPVAVMAEPSVKAIKAVLPVAVNEGLAVKADRERRPLETVEEEFIFRNCTIPFDNLANMLHEEFKRCFETKK